MRRWCQDLTFHLRDHTDYPGRKRKPEIDSERDTATYMAPTVISGARFCLPLGERKSCQAQSKEQNRAERGRLEPRIIVTNWHYGGADLAKSIPRIEGSKCGSPPSWFERNRFRPLVAIKPFGWDLEDRRFKCGSPHYGGDRIKHCAIEPWAQDLEDRGFKFGSHARVGHQYESPQKTTVRKEGLLIDYVLNNRQLLTASSLKLENHQVTSDTFSTSGAATV